MRVRVALQALLLLLSSERYAVEAKSIRSPLAGRSQASSRAAALGVEKRGRKAEAEVDSADSELCEDCQATVQEALVDGPVQDDGTRLKGGYARPSFKWAGT